MPTNGSTARCTRASPCSRRHHSGSSGGNDRRMRPVPGAEADGGVRQEPRVPPAAHVGPAPAPAGHVRLVLVRDPDREPVEGDVSPPGEVEDVLVGPVDVPVGGHRPVVAEREVPVERRRPAGRRAVDGDRLHPVNDVLEDERAGRLARDVEREERVRRGAPDVQEVGAAQGEDRVDRVPQLTDPGEVLGPRAVVGVARVRDLPVVGRARHHHVRSVGWSAPRKAGDRVLAPERHRAAALQREAGEGARGGHRPRRAVPADRPTGPTSAAG